MRLCNTPLTSFTLVSLELNQVFPHEALAEQFLVGQFTEHSFWS